MRENWTGKRRNQLQFKQLHIKGWAKEKATLRFQIEFHANTIIGTSLYQFHNLYPRVTNGRVWDLMELGQMQSFLEGGWNMLF